MRQFAVFLLLVCPAFAALHVGVSRVEITPEKPIYLSGYAARKKPSEGVGQPIFAKALAFQDGKGQRIVVVTTDLIGIPGPVADRVGAELEKRYRLPRAQLMLNSSHTHSGPVVAGNLESMFDLTDAQKQAIRDYTNGLVEKLVAVAGAAIGDLQPAVVSIGHGTATFAINRRQWVKTEVKIGLNGKGPVDHDVPVIRISTPGGKLRAVLFGYACHNTTLGGDLFQVNGDYAGYAQKAVEESNPGVTALFVLLCAGDANPNPRGTYALAEQHGRSLAKRVQEVLATVMKPVDGPLRASWKSIDLTFAPHTRQQFEEELKGNNWFKQRRAEAMLQAYDARQPVNTVAYPVQALRFGKAFTLVALGGEVVVDYDLRIKKEFAGEDTIIAGYSNNVMCYIPSRRVLQEGGYEAVDSMIYYGQPGPFREDVEETILGAVHQVMAKVGRKK